MRKKTASQPIPGAGYPGFADLSRFDAVKISSAGPLPRESFMTDDSLMIHLTVTGRCYARCNGCINSAITMNSDEPRNTLITFQETEPERDTAIINDLAGRNPHQTIAICFYGGEPFLAMDKMEKVWRLLREADPERRFRFMVYTNGEFLIKALNLYPDFMKDMWLYSVSIDGDKKQHNRVRKGTDLNKIKRNLRKLSEFYSGHVLHWSTLREDQSLWNCFDEFLRLYEEGLVNHFFWHWAEKREPFGDFQSFLTHYGQELEQIMDVYVQKIQGGQLLPIAHLNELILYLFTGKERGHTACGVELAKNYDIVSGQVYCCADLPSCLSIGELDREGKLDLREYDLNSLVSYKSWLGCFRCGVHAYCGGRCPVQVVSGSEERTYQYCQLMRLHVGLVQKRIPDILRSMKNNGITPQDIYERSAFLAKYTDVVP